MEHLLFLPVRHIFFGSQHLHLLLGIHLPCPHPGSVPVVTVGLALPFGIRDSTHPSLAIRGLRGGGRKTVAGWNQANGISVWTLLEDSKEKFDLYCKSHVSRLLKSICYTGKALPEESNDYRQENLADGVGLSPDDTLSTHLSPDAFILFLTKANWNWLSDICNKK